MGEVEKSQILLYTGDLLAEIQHKEGPDKNWRGPTLESHRLPCVGAPQRQLSFSPWIQKVNQ